MKKTDIQNILVIGLDTAALASSGNMIGYNVFAADYFGDKDLKQACEDSMSIITQEAGKSCGRLEANFSPNALLKLGKKLHTKHQMDVALLASGLEDSPQVLAELNDLIPIIGNHPKTIEKIRDKNNFFHELKKIGIPHPKTALANNLEECKRAAKDIGYPIIVKPLVGFGGTGIRKAKNRDELNKALQQTVTFSCGTLIQEFVPGTDVSVSFLSTKKSTMVLTLNEQLLGNQEVGQKEPFGYCGNIVPVSTDAMLKATYIDVVKKIASHFDLLGSNGVDMVISKDGVFHVVEVNPRFQGTLVCVERVLGLNLVKAHMNACIKGILPLIDERKTSTFCIRLILYARQRSIVPNLATLEEAHDIPFPEVIIEEGEPFCSLVVEERTRNSAVKKAKELTKRVYELEKRKLQ